MISLLDLICIGAFGIFLLVNISNSLDKKDEE
jgi:hypothetical protein